MRLTIAAFGLLGLGDTVRLRFWDLRFRFRGLLLLCLASGVGRARRGWQHRRGEEGRRRRNGYGSHEGMSEVRSRSAVLPTREVLSSFLGEDAEIDCDKDAIGERVEFGCGSQARGHYWPRRPLHSGQEYLVGGRFKSDGTLPPLTCCHRGVGLAIIQRLSEGTSSMVDL